MSTEAMQVNDAVPRYLAQAEAQDGPPGYKRTEVGGDSDGLEDRVAAPWRLDDEAVRLAVISRIGWIRRQQAEYRQQARQSRREMVSGESHYFQGRCYRFSGVEHDGPPGVSLLNNTTMELRVRPGTDAARREAVLNGWYRLRLREQLPPLMAKWEPKVGVMGAEPRIKKMKTHWGTCKAAARRIWLNLELAKKTASCLEYIPVHELVHLLERHHNERFRALMNRLILQWRMYREELNRAPLAHEDWAS